ncbi:Serine/threonine-protein kinase PknB [Enhygromyxa salina]|uniref:Serine/threonine-protein kinase PknB n=1 Tax=Enhygromyxa salina TaxID=215803 RepID=A0A2S9XDI9_9BACT|nr:AAA family ATPase [Enhygromyxa salina]PRP90926.1 Serine/threonine-protein kinase PknB [Enhygromyxa salina]
MTTFSQYTVLDSVHEGRESRVVRARRQHDDLVVVLKLPRRSPPSARDVARLQHEYTILSELALPGVVQAHALEHDDADIGLVLAALDGESLDRLLSAGQLPVEQALKIALGVARILADIHDHGVIHRDIKPSNIMVGPDRASVHVIDFGLATRLSQETQRLTSPDALEGTLAYLSPEQTGRMNRSIDRRTDLYSFGVTLYRMLTGVLPFTSDDPLELVHSHIARMPASPCEHASQVPEVVCAVAMKLLAKAPEDRYQSAHGLAADLDACLKQLAGDGSVLPFVLAQHEQAPRLRAPQRLFGRDQEIQVLRETLARVHEGGSELLLVTGYSGIGKSTLVHELHPIMALSGGTFIAGKFDQLARNTPYAALVQAFRDLVRQALDEPERRREPLRTELARALAGGGQVLVDLIPELGELLGPQPPVAELGPSEAQNRFNRLFDGFVQVFASGDAPLVVFLDDLQWSDLTSIRLLQALLGGTQPRRLLIVGAYRDNEVGPAHPLAAALEQLRASEVAVNEINLGPLQPADLCELLAEVLDSTTDVVEPLARAMYRKTQGNPFFIGQFLRTLQEDGSLRLDESGGGFVWDLEALNARGVAENVADFMDRRIRLRDAQTQRVLALAACIGHRFDLDTLATICELSPTEAAGALWEALEEGLVVPEGVDHRFIHHNFETGTIATDFGEGLDIAYRFSHDRVQQAAYSLINDERRAATHLQIGRMLLAHAGDQPRGDQLFEIANHLNIGASLITDPAQRFTLARLDLAAARRAKRSTAYAVALEYSRCGAAIELEPGPDADRLSFDLRCQIAECTYLTGAFADAQVLFDQLIEEAPSELDRSAVYTLVLCMYQVAGRYAEAVDVGAEALARFGVTLPATDAETEAAISTLLAELDRRLEGREIAALLDAPRMADPVQRAILGLLVSIIPCAYIGRSSMFPYLTLKGVSLSLTHGNSEDSCYVYSAYGVMLVGIFGQMPRGFAFSEMSVRLNERFGDAKLRGTLLHLHGDHVYFWCRHIRTGLPLLETAFQACIDVGDLVYASFLAFETVWQRFECGDPLPEVRQHAERFLAFAAESKNEAVYETIRLEQQFFASLAGTTRPGTLLDDATFEAEACLRRVTEASFGCGIAFYHIIHVILLVMNGQPQAALVEAEAVRGELGAIMAMPIEATFYMFEALAIAADARTREPADRTAALARLQEHLDRLALWAQHCPENFEHKHLLVRAEVARLADDPLAAEAFYDDAINSAQRHGFVQYEALANERCGHFYLERERLRIAALYLRAAQDGYAQWGAHAKVDQLDREMSKLPTSAASVARIDGEAVSISTTGSTARSTATSSASSWAFDLSTVLRLGQALAGEIELEPLLNRLMRIVLQNAGGTSCALVLERDGVLEVAASCTADPDAVQIHLRTPLAERPELPATVVLHVARTRESLVLADASEDSRFGFDPALADQPGRSILCLALVHRRRLSGVLYIEHTLVCDAFDRGRVELLEMLCSHAVTAVENALLYRNVLDMSAAQARTNELLEQEVELRTISLREANERLSAELQERERAERVRAELNEKVIRMQEAMLEELSTPLIPITDSIMVMPLIGTLDTRRAERVLETILEGAQRRRARVVILDISGMKTIDTPGVTVLVRSASALRLIGTRAMLTGMSPMVAQILVELGADLRSLDTFGSLQAGIAFALNLLES